MSGGLLTTLRYAAGALGVASFLSPLTSKYVKVTPSVLRVTLNVTWGYLFGSHVWEFLSYQYKDSSEEEPLLEKDPETLVSRGFERPDKFFLLSVFANALLLLATSVFVPTFKRLTVAGYVAMFSTLVNYFLVVPFVGEKTDLSLFKLVKPTKLSRFLLATTLTALTVYTLS